MEQTGNDGAAIGLMQFKATMSHVAKGLWWPNVPHLDLSLITSDPVLHKHFKVIKTGMGMSKSAWRQE